MTKINLKTLIKTHLKNQSFVLYGQKVRSIAAPDKEDGIEVLFRIMNQNEVIPAQHLIPIAEKEGLIQWIDFEVLKKLIIMLHSFKLHCPFQFFSINLSPCSLNDSYFFKNYLSFMKDSKEFAEKICIELTENHITPNLMLAKKRIEALKDLGCKIALDDFGTGFNSFYYLKTLPIDLIKLDSHFIEHLSDSDKNQTILKCIQDMAVQLNIKTVAECIENEETFNLVKKFQMDFTQGFWIGHPKPLDDYHEAHTTLHS